MAVLSRPTYTSILNEATRRLGGVDYTGFDARVKQWIASAVYFIGTTWHHPELDVTDSVSLSASSVSSPSDAHVVIGLRDDDNDVTLARVEFHDLLGRMTPTTQPPQYWARFGSTIYVDAAPATSINMTIFNYRTPTAPDFDAPTSPELGPEWDEIIVLKACLLGHNAGWRPDRAQSMAAELATLLQGVANPLLSESLLLERPASPVQDTSHMGARA